MLRGPRDIVLMTSSVVKNSNMDMKNFHKSGEIMGAMNVNKILI